MTPTVQEQGNDPPQEAVPPSSLDDLIDETLMESFPASDPPSFWGRESSSTDEAQEGSSEESR